jgi:hypothetical protein
MDRLTERVNQIPGLPIELERGYLKATESFAIYPLPGSQVVKTYMDGTTDQRLNYEIAMKHKTQGVIHSTLWIVQNELEALQELESNDGSFEFDEIIVPSKPFINNADDQGYYTFLLNIQAKITVFKEEK